MKAKKKKPNELLRALKENTAELKRVTADKERANSLSEALTKALTDGDRKDVLISEYQNRLAAAEQSMRILKEDRDAVQARLDEIRERLK